MIESARPSVSKQKMPRAERLQLDVERARELLSGEREATQMDAALPSPGLGRGQRNVAIGCRITERYAAERRQALLRKTREQRHDLGHDVPMHGFVIDSRLVANEHARTEVGKITESIS